MNDDKIGKYFGKKLAHHTCDVPATVWKGIEDRLTAAPLTVHRYRRYAVAAVVAAAVGVAAYLFVARQDSALPPAPAGVENMAVAPTPTTPAQPCAHTAERLIAQAAEAPATPAVEAVQEPVADERVTAATTDEQATQPVDAAVQDVETPHVSIAEADLYDHTAYAAVVQLQGKPVIPRNWLSVKANAMREQEMAVQYATRAADGEMVYRHKMPLSATISFEKRFGRWGVGTGVAYTYMHSEYESTGNARKGSQSLHYLGVPLYASYQIARVKRFSFYASAGGEVDFNIAGSQRESSESLAYSTTKERKVRDEKPQFSVQARVGAAFELVRHLDLYIEPTMGYYFHHESPVHSVWNDRPWNLSLSIGVRRGF